MPKNILIVTGSPRKNGNSFAMAQAFGRAASEQGHSVTRIDAAFEDFGGCKACNTCFSSGCACAFSPAFNRAAPALQAADVVVFCTPVYWYAMPAQLKAFVDHFHAFFCGQKNLSGKGYALLACCEEEDKSVMDGISMPLARAARSLGWHCLGEVRVTGVNRAGDILLTDGCQRAAALAQKI